MGRTDKLSASDIPQADSLSTIRVVLEAIVASGKNSAAIGEATKFSERHIRYRLQAARILGLLDESRKISASGQRLLNAKPGSMDEIRVLRAAVKKSRVVKSIIPDLLTTDSVPVARISQEFSRLTGLASATADRRARVLRSWARQLKVE